MRDDMVTILRGHKTVLHRQFDVQHLSLFGSASRDEATEESDVDLLVSFAGPATFDGYMDLKFFLEEILHRAVDLVTEGALRPQVKAAVEKELIHVT